MALINHVKREVNAKIVYYGAEGAGKSTTLRYLHTRIRPALRSDLKSLPASGDTLLYFDFSPFEHPVLEGYTIRFHIYTLPGRVTNPGAWKMTLKGADGVVALLDMSPGGGGGRQESVDSLRDYLTAYGVALAELPLVFQLNKSDIAAPAADEAGADLPGTSGAVSCRSAAITGDGVLEAFSLLTRQVMEHIARDLARQSGGDIPPVEEVVVAEDTGAAEPLDDIPGDLPVTSDSGSSAPDASHQDEDAPVVLLSAGAASAEGGVLRIPVDLSYGGVRQRITLAISVETLAEVSNAG